MIPFYIERSLYISKEIAEKERQKATVDEIDFLKSTLNEVNRKLEQEKREV
jgi:hypothetical protein